MMSKTELSNSYFCGNCITSPARKIKIGQAVYFYICDQCLSYLANNSNSAVSGSVTKEIPAKNLTKKKEHTFKVTKEVILTKEQLQEMELNYQKQFRQYKNDGLRNLRKPKRCSACGVTYNDGVGCLCNKRW